MPTLAMPAGAHVNCRSDTENKSVTFSSKRNGAVYRIYANGNDVNRSVVRRRAVVTSPKCRFRGNVTTPTAGQISADGFRPNVLRAVLCVKHL